MSPKPGEGHVRLLLQRHIPGLAVKKLDDAALIIATVVHETIHAAVAIRSQTLGSGSVADALQVIVMAYLRALSKP